MKIRFFVDIGSWNHIDTLTAHAIGETIPYRKADGSIRYFFELDVALPQEEGVDLGTIKANPEAEKDDSRNKE